MRLSIQLKEAVAGRGKQSYKVPSPTSKGQIDRRTRSTSKVVDKNRKFKLISIRDMRPLDLGTGKREPLIRGEGNICQRCGREHAVVWEVAELTPGQNRTWFVGSGCGPKILGGWSPEKSVLAKAKKKSTIEAKARAVVKKVKEMLEVGASYRNKSPKGQLVKHYDPEFQPKNKPHTDTYYYKNTMQKYQGIRVPHGQAPTKEDLEYLRRKWVDEEMTKKYGVQNREVAMLGFDGKTIQTMKFDYDELGDYWGDMIYDYKKGGGKIEDLIREIKA